jgi:MFS family permease
MMPLAMAILSGTFGREERARALSIFSGITGFALIVGPAIGGLITEQLGWRFIFWITDRRGCGRTGAGAFARKLWICGGMTSPGLLLVAIASLAWVWSLMRGNDIGWTKWARSSRVSSSPSRSCCRKRAAWRRSSANLASGRWS